MPSGGAMRGENADHEPRVYARAQSLFMQALSLPPEGRPAFLERAAGAGDTAVLAEVRALLRLHEESPEDERPAFLHPPEPLQLPREIGGYRIERMLGQGGMGRVFLARSTDGEPVAIKVLQPGLLSEQADQRFRREVSVLDALEHVGIVGFLGSGWLEGPSSTRYLAMEFVDGLPLHRHCEEHALPDRKRLELFRQVCDAVGHAHARGVIHRDLKPGNILVTEDGVPKVLDFGLARVLHPAVQSITLATRSGMLMGTLRYMSPEQARGTGADIGPPSDVYTLGIVGYEMLARRLPYSITGEETLARIFAAILTEEPSTLSDCRPDLPKDLDRVFACALAREPGDRYPTAAELGTDVGRHLRGEAVKAPRPRRKSAATKTWRRTLVVMALALLALAALGLGASALVKNRADARNLQAAYAALSEMEEMRHPEPETREDLERMVVLLAEARSALTRLPQDDFVGHLQRFTAWRLGECYYWIGLQDDDIRSLYKTREVWGTASRLPFDRNVGERLSVSLPFRTAVIDAADDVPWSGVAMIAERLAGFERPRENLALARDIRLGVVGRHVEFPELRYTLEALQTWGGAQEHERAIAFHVLGWSQVAYGAVVDSLPEIRLGLRTLSAADTTRMFPRHRGSYAAYLRDYGRAYLLEAELTRELADTDSALVRLGESLALSDPTLSPGSHGSTQRFLAETRLFRAELQAASPERLPGQSANSELREARTALGVAWNLSDTTRARTAMNLDLLEARWYRNQARLALDGAGGVGREALPGAAMTVATEALDEATGWVVRAERRLLGADFPVPRAAICLEAARIAVERAAALGGQAAIEEARIAVQACERIFAPSDAPRFNWEVGELRARLEDVSRL